MTLLTVWPGAGPALHAVYLEAHGRLIFNQSLALERVVPFLHLGISSENKESALTLVASMDWPPLTVLYVILK